MSSLPSPVCGIPGHPDGGHGGHPLCNTHGPMHFRGDDGMWTCHGFDGEGCATADEPDAYRYPEYHNALWADTEGHSTYERDPDALMGLGRRFPALCHCERGEAHYA